jgi:hypothetical protein
VSWLLPVFFVGGGCGGGFFELIDDDSGDCLLVARFLAWMEFFVGFYGEFDPGSGRTLAACLTHASRAERPFWGYSSGERVSNT